ncbi:MAG: HAD-IA family hydrolase [Verrucomicrobiales bacterium]
MSHQNIQAVSFDAAGTLIHLAEPVGASYSRVAALHGIEADTGDLDRAFRIVWKRTPLPFSFESTIRDPNEKEWWRRLVREVFEEAEARLPPSLEFDAFFEALYEHFEKPGTWNAAPEALAVVETVGRRYPCIVLSNFDGRLRRILGDLGLLDAFDGVVLSCETGASKPDRRIFEAGAKKLSKPPSAILHVGDDPVCDWEGAEAAGFQVFKVGTGQRPLSELFGELSLA